MKFDFYDNPIIIKSYAKINLYLSVKNKRADGYHNMEMLMQSVDLHDIITIGYMKTGGIQISCNFADVPLNEDNLVYKTCEIFFKYFNLNIERGIKVDLNKTIPTQAGLAGGSGNAAAVLCALNYITNTNLSEKDLIKIASEIGSDVPFCVIGGTCIAKSKGEVLTKIDTLKDKYFLIVKGEKGVSTSEAFKKLKYLKDNRNIETMLNTFNIEDILYNEFENVIPDYLRKIKKDILKFHPLGALMSGSGSAFFGMFDDIDICKHAYESLKTKYKEVYITKPINKGVEFIF